MKYFFIFTLIIILSACQNTSPLPTTPVTNTPLEQTAETAPEIQLELTPPPNNQEGAVDQGAFEGEQPLAARVNNQPIFLDPYQKQVAQLEQALKAQNPAITGEQEQATLSQLKRQVLDSLIDQALIEQEANRLGLTITEALLEAKIQESVARGGQAQFETWLAANNLTLAEFKETLRAELMANQVFEHITRNVPDTAEQVQMRQILVADEATARAIIKQLKSGADFAALAQAHSLDESSRANGGSLGWFPRELGLVPPEVETIAFSIHPGEVSGPIKSPLGLHIIQLENREAERPLPPEIHQALKQQTFLHWLTEQRARAAIEKFIEF
ncbi:MAG: peptidylprolyl isomerase [Anaerolineae bacterium]|nr:peptidylprolyl isomerase [Anaerolineae bacterium]